MATPPPMPPSGAPRLPPKGIPPAVLLYALCLVPITAFAGYAVTYGQDEEALERKLREKYGNEIRQVESKKQQMSDMYMAAIKNPGSNPEQEERLQQVLRGGRGDIKRQHAIDSKYFGTEEGKQRQELTREEMLAHQEEERKKMKKIKRKLKKLKKQKNEEDGDASSSDTESEAESESTTSARTTTRKMEAAATAAAALAVAAAATSKAKAENELDAKIVKKLYSKDSKKKKEKSPKSEEPGGATDMSQVLTLTAVAGAAALVGFLVGGGGSRRQ